MIGSGKNLDAVVYLLTSEISVCSGWEHSSDCAFSAALGVCVCVGGTEVTFPQGFASFPPPSAFEDRQLWAQLGLSGTGLGCRQ